VAYKQVGVMALRSPAGEFLPAQPIYEEYLDEETAEAAEAAAYDDIASVFARKMKQYIDGCKAAGIKLN